MRQLGIAVFSIGALCVSFYLAGVVFVVNNDIGIQNATYTTWFDYWSAYPQSREQLLKLFALCFGVLGLLPIVAIVRGQSQPLHGAARFATDSEIRSAGLHEPGILVGAHRSKYLSFGGLQFVSLIAPTRSDKGVGIVIPNLLNYADSVVCLDVKGENFGITSGYRAANGQPVFCFAPFSDRSHTWNPLASVQNDIPELLSIGYTFYPAVTGNRESMWNDTARDLFVGLALYLIETPGLPVTIGEILRQSSGKGQPPQKYLQNLVRARNYNGTKDNQGKTHYIPKPPDSEDMLSERCVDALSRFINAPGNTAGGILATFTAPLTLWSSPAVDAATSGSDIDLSTVRQSPVSIYICIPVNKLDSAGVLLNLFFDQLIKQNTAIQFGQSGNNTPCLILLDEFLAPGYIPILAKSSAHIAGYGLRLLTVAQSIGQISKPISDGGYGRDGAQELLDNHALRIYYPTKNLSDATAISDSLGFTTVKTRSRQLGTWRGGTETEQRRALLLPQEFSDMPKSQQIIRLENVKPIKCRKICYYKDRTFVDRLKHVSPSLREIKGKPTHAQLLNAVSLGELSAPVPLVKPVVVPEPPKPATRETTVSDIDGGVNLGMIAINMDAIDTPDEPLSDADLDNFIDQFWNEIDGDNTEQIDTETGEVLTDEATDYIDLSEIKEATL